MLKFKLRLNFAYALFGRPNGVKYFQFAMIKAYPILVDLNLQLTSRYNCNVQKKVTIPEAHRAISTQLKQISWNKNIKSFISTSFSQRTAGQHLQIMPPHLLIHQHRLHFAWMKFQTVSTKILDIIKPSCSWPCNWPLPTPFII